MFVADTAQSIYSTSWLVKGTELYQHRFGYDKEVAHLLQKNYRTTTQIAEAAYSLIREDSDIVNDDNFVKPSLIDKQGIYPVFARYKYNWGRNFGSGKTFKETS